MTHTFSMGRQILAVRKNNFQNKHTNKQNDLEVIIGRDSPGGRQEITVDKLTNG